jgi:hypothetical protein
VAKSDKKTKELESARKAWYLGLAITAVATILAGAAGEFYKDLKAWLSPGEVFGSYLLLSPNDENSRLIEVAPVKLRSHGFELWGDEEGGEKSWVYTGFINMGYIVLAYRSRQPLGIGFGQYFLEPRDGARREFIGHMIGNFCGHKGERPDRRIMRCNAVMVRGEPGGKDERDARETYQAYLAEPCALLEEAAQVPPEKCKAG